MALKIRTNFWDVKENAPGRVFDNFEELEAYCLENEMIPAKMEYFSDHTVRHGQYEGSKVAGMSREELIVVVENLDEVCGNLLEAALK